MGEQSEKYLLRVTIGTQGEYFSLNEPQEVSLDFIYRPKIV